jgi:DNA-binding NtrC family response regulator
MSQPRSRILIVDDEYSVRDSLFNWFRKDGYEVVAAEDAESALRHLAEGDFDVALVDIRMPGMDGIELQRRIHESRPETAVIMITAYASVETAVEALKEGAFDYITKPLDPDELSHLVTKAIEQRRLRQENVVLKESLAELSRAESIIGESPPMERLNQLILSVAKTDATVLIRGESGTGKELVARAIHANSPRRYLPIVPVNCGALSETLLESELFGHEKGAFTGAQYRRKGKFEMAHGGTLFLDEIGTLTLKTQVELLRVLESKEFTRLGGSKPIKVDFRLISATNQDLERLLEEGSLRDDLYYRINVFIIDVPPLRERGDDVLLLARHFLDKFSTHPERRFDDFSEGALKLLTAHDWPGNVRELGNAIERATVVGTPPVILAADLPLDSARPRADAEAASLETVEQRHIASMLERTGWNITRAADILGIDRTTLYNKIRKYGLQK